MIHIKELRSGLSIFKALSSEIRIEILELLTEYDSLNLNEIAEKLGLTNGAITMHIKKLEESGLIDITTAVGRHGIQKICYLNEDILTVNLRNKNTGQSNVYEVELKVGHYCDYHAEATCGLATKDSIVGEFDNPRYFADPEHINAGIVWLTKGFLEYRIPNYLKPNQRFSELQFIMELSSEAPGYNDDFPSDIVFSVNGIDLGVWTSPGDFGTERGTYNPDWWPPHLNQYGLIKLLRINENGSFIDGCLISHVTIADINLKENADIKFKIGVAESRAGGLTIYGQSFGNYQQDLIARVIYDIVAETPLNRISRNF
ncbi:winged helix-turn-helix transcriptional regulator [Paenibacillus sp. sptzw28]|uniref:ArsR/SmtB family transcription factor n=1 Tax=Paenibacillus sp. sptzw28 TaxID=715179 RepID=UPI001C6E0846|nr:winged helix-turn-helix transcriptional regulator [Paenibacillus sp. sptzw28]QYR22543.1 winged helix-turn-helix transcriptional regulator [Paenibacillus sp. sptzw28]